MKRAIMTLCLLVAVATVSAQQQMTLTLQQALDLALSENTTIKVADTEVERYDYVRRETWGNLLPQITAGGRYTRTIIKQEMAKGLSFGADNTIAFNADASLALYAPTVYRTLKMNDKQRLAAIESARGSRITLTNDVKKTFYNILLAEQSLNVLEESKKTSEQVVNDTQTKFDNGLVAEYDLLTAQVSLSNIEPNIIQAENAIKATKLMLKMLLSIPEDVEISLDADLRNLRDQVLMGADGLNTDISENSDLRNIELQTEVLKEQLRVSNALRLPTLGAFAAFTYSGNDLGQFKFGSTGNDASTTPAPAPAKNSFYWQKPFSVGVNLSVPIFTGLTKSNKAKQIKNNIAQLEMQTQYTRDGLEVQVRTAIDDLLSARDKMHSVEQTVGQATKAYSISETRYNAGAGTILELNTARLSLTQAQLNYTQSIYDYLAAKADYDKIIGK